MTKFHFEKMGLIRTSFSNSVITKNIAESYRGGSFEYEFLLVKSPAVSEPQNPH